MANPTATIEEPSAVDRVINTIELLEGILINLDMKTLLLSQRVSKQFNAVIAGSTSLQQALFFKQAPKDGHKYGEDGRNPLLIQENGLKKARFIEKDLKTRIHGHRYGGRMAITYEFSHRDPPYMRVQDTASWQRMYLTHCFEEVAPEFCIRSQKCSMPRESIRMPGVPMKMADYDKIVMERYRNAPNRLPKSSRGHVRFVHSVWDPESKTIKPL